MKPHKHAEVIKAWADGHAIQYRNGTTITSWTDMPTCTPNWYEGVEYRVKPEPKPDVVKYFYLESNPMAGLRFYQRHDECPIRSDLRVTFDGETFDVKKAEVL